GSGASQTPRHNEERLSMNAAVQREIVSAVAKPTAVALRDITCRFGEYVAVRSANLTIADGEFVSVIGPTGCGKSTLLNVIAGLLQPTEGTTSIFGQPLTGLNRKAGYLF